MQELSARRFETLVAVQKKFFSVKIFPDVSKRAGFFAVADGSGEHIARWIARRSMYGAAARRAETSLVERLNIVRKPNQISAGRAAPPYPQIIEECS